MTDKLLESRRLSRPYSNRDRSKGGSTQYLVLCLVFQECIRVKYSGSFLSGKDGLVGFAECVETHRCPLFGCAPLLLIAINQANIY